MGEITLENLLAKICEYNLGSLDVVKKAYHYAETLHAGQFRQSGEPYIIHPLNVAYILADLHADMDTICAGLLHDTIEDTGITKEDIAHEFNPTVANLVDGVTKLANMNFSSKEAQSLANTRKIITGITEDVRIIIIKLADRLHNMRTLQYKSSFKQKENSLETMEIFAPLAYYIGAYRIKSELEDLAFQYLKPDLYRKIDDQKSKIEMDYTPTLKEIKERIKTFLSYESIASDIKIRTKNIYGIYKILNQGHRMSDIHDLFALKIMIDKLEDCYRALGLVHQLYHPVNEMFKDYICNPKTNMYQSLHTTVFAPHDRLVQVQIRTFDMDKIASFGLTAYWDSKPDCARDIMQQELKEKYQFYNSLIEMNAMFGNNQEFVSQVKRELFSEAVYVYTTKGDMIELPKGSTPIDFAYRIHTDVGNTMTAAFVNDELVPINYVLQNRDRVRIVTDVLSFGPRSEWLEYAKTSSARRRIREFSRKKLGEE